MSNSKLVTKTKLTPVNYDKGRDGHKIKKITIHHTAGVMTIDQIASHFANGNREVSAHYGIGVDGKIVQCVDEKDTAWTDGNWVSNCTSVTIETSNNKVGGSWTVSDVTLNSLIKLVADIGKRNNLGTLIKGKNVTWHSMYANTKCPAKYLLSKMDYIVSEANKINSKSTSTSLTTKKKYTGTFPKLPSRGYFKNGDKGEQVKLLQKFLNWSVGSNLVEDSVIGSLTIQAVKKFQKTNSSLDNDGLFGKKTLQFAKTFKK